MNRKYSTDAVVPVDADDGTNGNNLFPAGLWMDYGNALGAARSVNNGRNRH